MSKITIRMAKATQDDMLASYDLMQILDAIDSDYYPSRPQEPGAADTSADDPTFFDDASIDHLRFLHQRLKDCLARSPGFVGRLVGGMSVILENDILDPNDQCLALHPRFETAAESVPQSTDAGTDNVEKSSS